MGHALADWQSSVLGLVRDDASKDLSATQVSDYGVLPAITQYSIDQPRQAVAALTGTGTAYVELPDDWGGHSRLLEVEYPTGQVPRCVLDPQTYAVAPSPDDVTVEQLLLLDARPADGDTLRIRYSAPWPQPGTDPATDLIDDLGFHAVSRLAAAMLAEHLATEASRDRMGAIPTDFVDGTTRTKLLLDLAKAFRTTYNAFLGLAVEGEDRPAQAPASARFDFDPSFCSVFHGGRR